MHSHKQNRIFWACIFEYLTLSSECTKFILVIYAYKQVNYASRTNVCFFLQPEKTIAELVHWALLQNGRSWTIGGDIVTIKISSESGLFEGGSSILEALDRLFKLFWIFEIQYTASCENFFKLLQNAMYRLDDGPVPKSVAELLSIIDRYKQ